MSTSTVVEHFERYEVKFWAPRPKVDAAVARLAGFMQEDEVAQRAGASQLNTSLYLDSPAATFFEQHVSDSPDRIKLRVRFYGERPTGDAFFEIKRRQCAVVMKRRAVVPVEQARQVLDQLHRQLPIANEALQAFQYLALRCQARPHLLVRASRRALRAIDRSQDVRVTVDSEVAWQPVRAQSPLDPRPELWRFIGHGGKADASRALVEVKFRRSRPLWLGHLLGQLTPWRVSFSKYIAACLDAKHDPFLTLDAA
jgi:hypothetical protein